MGDDSITVLEDRINILELKAFGQTGQIPEMSLSIVENLLESQKIVSSALSGREKVSSVLKRLDQLEAVLDPMYEDSVVDCAAKLSFILSMEQDLEEITRQLVRVNELSPCMESEQLRHIPQLMKQLGKLTSTMVEQKQKNDLMEDKIDELIKKYTEINNGVTAVFATLDNKVKELEIKARPKKVIE